MSLVWPNFHHTSRFSLRAITRERDTRWQGRLRFGPLLLLPIAGLLLILWIITAAKLVYNMHNQGENNDGGIDTEPATNVWWGFSLGSNG